MYGIVIQVLGTGWVFVIYMGLITDLALWRCGNLRLCAIWQVVYPALDAKVKNVTLQYSVEHADEVSLERICIELECFPRACGA